ncbi:single-stranded DNA-binding protein [Rothia dentocariosa]|uniref:single-stranded DNA-binding protein n=1 Tax=Rothia dentocariosa TaxID=2047 RepID=UPI0028805F8F|nr:single-stranded DNA-binding protein [Rothia dentocariosa]
MAGETIITVVGNLTSDPELRYTPAGAAVANFTIASTPRTYNRQTGQWEDGEALFLRASIWRDYAENVAETLKKGTRVIAQGRLKSRSYETKEGERRTSMEIELDEIGPALRYATAQVTRSQRTSGGNFGGQQGGNFGGNNFGNNPQQGGFNNSAPQQGFAQQQGGNGYSSNAGFGGGAQQAPAQPAQQAPAADPWTSQSGGNYDWGTGADDEPPF